MGRICVAFWNLENLFDIENSPRRSEKLARTLSNELSGWSEDVLNKKLSQLSKAITSMNNGDGPDILGVCEVENRHVLELLSQKISTPTTRYNLCHHDMSDKRGIDVAFLYKEGVATAGSTFSHEIQKRTATRDIFQVNFTLGDGKTLVAIGNHWPSRSGGQYKSEPYRMMAGETLAYFHERIASVLGENIAIIAMGDFNDEPFDRSLVEYALSERTREKVLNARSPKLFNLMWGLMGRAEGTHYFNNSPNLLDQFLVNKGLINGSSGITVDLGSVHIFKTPEMIRDGDYPSPIRFGRKDDINESGFSDHLPICVYLDT